MPYNLSKHLQDVLGGLGRTETFTATAGSTTMVENSLYATLPDPPSTDFANGWSLFVARDSAGASAAPEDEFSLISGYASSTYQFTITALTSAVAAGDEIVIADGRFPLRELIRLVNRAISKFDVPLTDTSLTTLADTTEYTLPLGYKKQFPILVEYQGHLGNSSRNDRIPVNPVRIVQSGAGLTSTLILPQLTAGRTLYITGITAHPQLTSFSSVIREEIHPDLLVAASIYEALLWYNAQQEGRSEYWEKRLKDAHANLEAMKTAHPIDRPSRNPNSIPMWGYDESDPGIPSPILT